uniref:Curli production assembly/transport component CsgG n=1 Tax=Gelidibacter sp. TaxID=2018083 RepID=UPI00404AB6A5
MIEKPFFKPFFLVIYICVIAHNGLAQQDTLTSVDKALRNQEFYKYRGTNAVEMAAGTSVMNGDLSEPLFEISSRVGYKRIITPHLNISFSYNKFNLGYKEVLNEGFMSFDLNLESTLLPNDKFSPFIFAGGGYNAANYFEQTATKVQGGIGIEYIVMEKVGIKLFSDYNYVFSDELDGVVFGDSDDVYWRVLVGINFYFGGDNKKEKILKGRPTIINSNPIIPRN